jgi:hypothetical protein
MLVFQTFEDTTLTDVVTVKKDSIIGKLRGLKPVQKLHDWTKDPITQQPVNRFYLSNHFLLAD